MANAQTSTVSISIRSPGRRVRLGTNSLGAVFPGATLFLVFGLSSAMACARVAENPSHPLVWLRFAAAIAAMGIVVFARRGNLIQRALFAFALESAVGVATLIYVDAPYVNAHSNQIASVVTATYYGVTKRDILPDLRALRNSL